MSLTSEQFNMLATKEEMEDLKGEVDKLSNKVDEGFDRVSFVLDTVVSKLETLEGEKESNTIARDRINRDLWRIKKKKLGEMEVLQPLD